MANKPDILVRLKTRREEGASPTPAEIDDAIAEIERLRSLAGAVTDGSGLAEIRKEARHGA